MNQKIIELKKLFLEKVSLGNDVDEDILKKIDEILYLINGSEVDDLRQMSANLSHELHEIGSNSVPYLLMLLLNKVEAVSYKPNYKGSNVSHEIDMELFISFFKRCFRTCEKKGIRILNFKLPYLDKSEKLNIYCCTRSMLDKYVSEPIDVSELNAEMPPRAICLGISKVLSKKYDCQHEFFIQFSSILERMNRDGLYQEARDYADEALICSHADDVLYYGHYARFSIYTSQTNVIDSLLNGCLLFTSLCNEESICAEFMEKAYIIPIPLINLPIESNL